MNKVTTYPLRLPKSLKDEVTKLAKRDGTSINQFIAIAVAERVAAIETAEYFHQRARGANLEAFKKVLYREGGEAPRLNDENIDNQVQES